MASRRILRDFRLFKDNGAVCTDGSVAFYVPNTTTPLTLYSDQALLVSIGTSEAFDVNGYAPEIYASTAIGVKVIITGTGVTTMTWDYYEQAPTAGTMETGSFTDPGADRLIMWDESAGSGGSAVACSLDTGLSISGTTLSLATPLAAIASGTAIAAAQQISLTTSAVAPATAPLTLTSTDAGATGAALVTYHNSASPAGNDVIGTWYGYGKDSAGNQQLYGHIDCLIQGATSTSEEGKWWFYTTYLGADTFQMYIGNGVAIGAGVSGNGNGTLTLSSSLFVHKSTAVPAGGTTGAGIIMSSTSNLGIFFGSGVPTLSAAQGSLYIRTDGSSTSTRMYINTNGSTTWTNVTTAA